MSLFPGEFETLVFYSRSIQSFLMALKDFGLQAFFGELRFTLRLKNKWAFSISWDCKG